MIFNNVDFPEPLAPTIAIFSFEQIFNRTSETAFSENRLYR
ncbi:hypothetical protein ACR01W_001562 [Enterococcus faecium]